MVVRNDGVVLGAHCNCTAGLGESCSHVSAVLFSIWQHNNGRKEEIAVTSKKCKWATPSEDSLKKVEYQQGKDIIFNNTQQYKKGKSSKGHSASPAFPPLTAAEQAQLYNNLSQCRTQEEQIIKPVVLSVVKEYAASYVPKAVMLNVPEPLTNLYNKQLRDLNLAELQDRAEALFEDITVTKEQVQKICIYHCWNVCVSVSERGMGTIKEWKHKNILFDFVHTGHYSNCKVFSLLIFV